MCYLTYTNNLAFLLFDFRPPPSVTGQSKPLFDRRPGQGHKTRSTHGPGPSPPPPRQRVGTTPYAVVHVRTRADTHNDVAEDTFVQLNKSKTQKKGNVLLTHSNFRTAPTTNIDKPTTGAPRVRDGGRRPPLPRPTPTELPESLYGDPRPPRTTGPYPFRSAGLWGVVRGVGLLCPSNFPRLVGCGKKETGQTT